MSSKLSGRRSTARKPSICISIPPNPRWTDALCALHILWTDELPTPPVVLIDQGVELTRIAPDSVLYRWEDLSAGPNQLREAELTAPFGPTHNFLSISGNDEGGAPHQAYALFEPGQSVPFAQTIELYAIDYPEPGSVIATIAPVAT